ncbi:hypothetical protein CFP56_034397 [Quercus suber]|uniref:F-box protein n=1 Tax=Quercus suber TaxID=58331 RepID=A0AAW0JDZ3_QUESU
MHNLCLTKQSTYSQGKVCHNYTSDGKLIQSHTISIMSEWAGLLDLILSEITRCISVYDDFVIFGAVCKSWRRVYSMKKPSSSPRCPWLLLGEEKKQKNHTRVFFNVFDNKVYNFKLPELVGRICIGTSFG